MRAIRQRPALLRAYALLAGGSVLGLVLLFAAVPRARPALATEDRLLENGQFAIYLATMGVALLLSWRGAVTRPPATAWLLALLAGVAALDEIDWGRRLLDFDAPQVEGVQIDTSQRLAEAAALLVGERGGFPALAAAVLLSAAVAYRYRYELVGLCRVLAGSMAFGFVVLWLGLSLLTAVAIEDVLEPGLHVKFAEELVELCAALALLWAALALVTADTPSVRTAEECR